jgi:hypothetical protein
MPDFVINNWRAWAPGISIKHANLIPESSQTDLRQVPKLLHRRLSTLAKAVFLTAEKCCISAPSSIPVVFSSSHGEICKSLEMLKTLQREEELSPTAFSLSVHNAIAGLFSIAFNNHEEITVIAPCQEGIAAAFAEGLGMLQEDKPEVLLIFYDEPIADFYPTAPYHLNAPEPCVLALRISRAGDGTRISLQRSQQGRNDGEQPVQLLAFIRYLLADDSELELGNPGRCWTWRKL